jgi:hypothetical protein
MEDAKNTRAYSHEEKDAQAKNGQADEPSVYKD